MDPWNGSGTTTYFAVQNGYRAIGFDLNPVMAVVAKARLLPQSEIASIVPLLADILKKAARSKTECDAMDPLLLWFGPEAAANIRHIERAVFRLLVSERRFGSVLSSIRNLSSLAAFFHVGMFGAVRQLLRPFRGSNPTWLIRPNSIHARLRPSATTVRDCFASYVRQMVSSSLLSPTECDDRSADSTIRVASSENLPVEEATIDFVLSSPPYCTRIDYGIATSPELAALGFQVDSRLCKLRNRLIGTPTIHAALPGPCANWGTTCVALLERIGNHRSKAARSYYYKTYVQYFAAIARSLLEVGRCLKRQARCVLVVQDSYFKDVRIDLATIFGEMAETGSLKLRRQVDFPTTRTFGSVNSRSRHYRAASSATESVLCFVKDA